MADLITAASMLNRVAMDPLSDGGGPDGAGRGNLSMLAMPQAPSIGGASAGEGPFAAVLEDAVKRVEGFQADSRSSIQAFLSGADVDLHQVALSVQKAETSFELFTEVRNKVVQAYQEIMRTQV
jgi:flagellar hook-basal body complex protein FliE